jgi:hypothetical protein
MRRCSQASNVETYAGMICVAQCILGIYVNVAIVAYVCIFRDGKGKASRRAAQCIQVVSHIVVSVVNIIHLCVSGDAYRASIMVADSSPEQRSDLARKESILA